MRNVHQEQMKRASPSARYFTSRVSEKRSLRKTSLSDVSEELSLDASLRAPLRERGDLSQDSLLVCPTTGSLRRVLRDSGVTAVLRETLL